MAVAFDASAETFANLATGVTQAITIGAGATGIAVFLSFDAIVTGLTVTGAGTTFALVPGTDSGNAGLVITKIFAGGSPLTGAQTISVSWTNIANAGIGVVSVTGGSTTTPMINGTSVFNNSTTGTESLAITTAPLHMTHDVLGANDVISAPTQTQTWNDAAGTILHAGSRRITIVGTSITHTWSVIAGASAAHSGADFQTPAAVVAAFDDSPGPIRYQVTPYAFG